MSILQITELKDRIKELEKKLFEKIAVEMELLKEIEKLKETKKKNGKV